VSPGDVFLISDAAEERRKWLNSFISQTDRQYLDALIRYNHAMGERNKLLKQQGTPAFGELLEILDERLEQYGEVIHRRRAETIERLRPMVADYYRTISGDREQVELSYRSELNDKSFHDILLEARQKDMLSQFTSSGIHRDDMTMSIGGYPLRKYGSQGQQKSFLIALKLAQHTILTEISSERPILLLDDLFDKLDSTRLEALISLVNDGRFGQILISDCNHQRLTSILDACAAEYTLFGVDAGEVNLEI
jgi:DNA replication and repair protein RecF